MRQSSYTLGNNPLLSALWANLTPNGGVVVVGWLTYLLDAIHLDVGMGVQMYLGICKGVQTNEVLRTAVVVLIRS